MILRPRTSKRLIYLGAVVALLAAVSCGQKLYTVHQVDDQVGEGVSISISIMLIGSISFMMGLFYLVNNDDEDIRLYSWKVISATISIFCAVLLFQAFNGLVEVYLIDGGAVFLKLEEESPPAKIWECVVDVTQLLFWLTMMQIVLAITSGAISEQSEWLWQPENMEEVELATKSWAVLFAHISAFAAINAWGSVQQNMLGYNPATAILIVPIGMLGLQGVYKAFDKIREGISMGDDGEIDENEKTWDDETEESENDVIGLSLSFLTAQVLRFIIGGHLPDEEGKEPHIYGFHHSAWHCKELMFMGVVFLAGLVIVLQIRGRYPDAVEEIKCERKLTKKQEEEAETEYKTYEWIIRPLLQGQVYCSCGMAWCFFYGTYWTVAATGWTDQDALLQVIIALVISACSFSVIYAFDKIEDSGILGEEADKVIKSTIDALGILIGFSWEQSFDVAVDVLSEAGEKFIQPAFGRLFMSLILTLIVFPAWKKQILTQEMELREESTTLGKVKKKFEDKLAKHAEHFCGADVSERELDHAHLAMKLHRRKHHGKELAPCKTGEKPLKHYLLTADGLKDVEEELSVQRQKLIEKGGEAEDCCDDGLLESLLPPHMREPEEDDEAGFSFTKTMSLAVNVIRFGRSKRTEDGEDQAGEKA